MVSSHQVDQKCPTVTSGGAVGRSSTRQHRSATAPWAPPLDGSSTVIGSAPSTAMNAAEAPVILNLIRKLKEDKSKTILLVEHKMDVVRELADRIIVLHNGTLVADGEPAEVIASPVVQEAYLGLAPQDAPAQDKAGEALQ